MESSYPAQANDNALLISPWMNPVSGGQCLKFYYSMYGGTIGELKVRLELAGGTSYLLFYENGNQGMGWNSFAKDIDTSAQYRVCRTFHLFVRESGERRGSGGRGRVGRGNVTQLMSNSIPK